MTRDQIVKDLEDIFMEINSYDKFYLDEPFWNQEMNSLDEVEFLMGVESKYDMSISDEIANKIKKPSDYIELILEALNQKTQS